LAADAERDRALPEACGSLELRTAVRVPWTTGVTMLKILGIGGGSGLPVLLTGLKSLAGTSDEQIELDISAVVCVSDDGGSSGLLRQALGIPAVGDIRNCLVALSALDSTYTDLFQHRFPSVDGVAGHSLGNLIIAGLHELSGGLSNAVERASSLLQAVGRVMPATEAPVTLAAEFEDGTTESGECRIAAARKRIRRLSIDPSHPSPAAGVLETIEEADAIVLGPGSLYTSILPSLMVPQIAEAVRTSRGIKIFICNLMTQSGETHRYSAGDHLRVLESCLGPRAIDICVVNSRPLETALLRRYRETGSRTVEWDDAEIVRMGIVPVPAELLFARHFKIRHDSEKLARLVVALTQGALRALDIVDPDRSLPARSAPGRQLGFDQLDLVA
jgi:uncharacterized cofD-like protein